MVCGDDLFQEKDDIEAKYKEVNEKSEQASLQLSGLQQELDRTRQHANEALKAIDVERQQLRSANNRYIKRVFLEFQIESFHVFFCVNLSFDC